MSSSLSYPSSFHLQTLNPKSPLPKTTITMSLSSSSFKSTGCPKFDHLINTFTIKIKRAQGMTLNVPLISPFTIASSRLTSVSNVAICVELDDGSVGWGEAPILPAVTSEDQPLALFKVNEACEFLRCSSGLSLGFVLREVDGILGGHQFASVRAGVEMALIDAAAKSIDFPLWQLFGGAQHSITTDITIPIVSPAEASELATKYRKLGFETLKLKVGKNLSADIEVLKAIRAVHPDCLFILDANEGYSAGEAIEALEKLNEIGVTPVLFEQPVHRDDWDGLRHVTQIAKKKFGISVAADESCRSLSDVMRIINGDLANVINIKLAKLGVLESLNIIKVVRESGLSLMIGGMVETRLAMGFAGHLAAGLGCFKFIDLDTPLLLAEDPVLGGYEALGAFYKFTNAAGSGSFLRVE